MSASAPFVLSFTSHEATPPLAWCLHAKSRSRRAVILHGPRVETSINAFVEGAWDGDFDEMAMDQGVCMGSGGRIRDGEIVLSAPSHTLEGLYAVRIKDELIVSNSLPFALARSGLDLDPHYRRYLIDLRSIMRGLRSYKRTIPTLQGVPIERYFFCNLVIDSDLQVRREDKAKPPHFTSFAGYRDYLRTTLKRLAENASDCNRSYTYRLMASVSRGYDSPACAVLAKECGCTQALTITDSSWGNPIDSGREIGELLFERVVERKRQDYFKKTGLPEAEFAALGDAGDVPFSSFEDVLEGCMLVTGFPNAWDPGWSMGADVRRHDASGSSLGEFRLRVGFIHAPIPFVGCENHSDISAIGRDAELDPWRIGGRYDRPIARRIAEEGGVPRHMFGQRKSAAATWWTLNPKLESKAAYDQFRRVHRRPRDITTELIHSVLYWSSRRWIGLGRLVTRAFSKAGVHVQIPQVVPLPFTEPASEALLVQWGISIVIPRYPAAASAAPEPPPAEPWPRIELTSK